MKTNALLRLVAVTAALSVSLPAMADPSLVTDATGYAGPQLNLTGYNNGSYNFSYGPVSLSGGITVTATPGNGWGSVIGQGGYGLGENGALELPATYIGLDSGTGWVDLSFAAPVSSFGGYWNYSRQLDDFGNYVPDGDSPWISIVDGNDLSWTFDLMTLAPIETDSSSINDFRFRGIVGAENGIKSVRFGGAYMALAGTADGSIPVAAPVPEPETYAMLLAGLGLMSLVARRRRKSA